MPSENRTEMGGRNPDGTILPGTILNPNGRPKGARSFTTKVRDALEKIADGEKDVTNETLFIKAILKKSIVDQDVSMMRTVWEQLDGKPLQKTELTGAEGVPLIPETNINLDALVSRVEEELKKKKV